MTSSNPVPRPEAMNYDFYYHVDDPEYDPDDWDEEVYYEDLQKWIEVEAWRCGGVEVNDDQQ